MREKLEKENIQYFPLSIYIFPLYNKNGWPSLNLHQKNQNFFVVTMTERYKVLLHIEFFDFLGNPNDQNYRHFERKYEVQEYLAGGRENSINRAASFRG